MCARLIGCGFDKLTWVAPGTFENIVARLNLSNCSFMVILVRLLSCSGDLITLMFVPPLLFGVWNLNCLLGVLLLCG